MPLVIEIGPEAAQDLATAAGWYDNERPGLGREFLHEVDALLRRMGDLPLSFPLYPGHSTVHQAPLPRRFPYRLLFEVTEERLYVVACSHVRQRPQWWAERVRRDPDE